MMLVGRRRLGPCWSVSRNPNAFVARTIRQLVALRKSKGITTERMAELLGTAAQNVRRIEAGQNITLRMLDRIAIALGVEVILSFRDTPGGSKKPPPGKRV
ncbi:MAG: helix-turn-helix transcriptional regulator [Labilithrix sp.]|nr:helix-turn-helix transcriptional regulator [Labilithrix sp.]MCW5812611.1 helix-turn-helix transcriptional regulator [Labilithrix sp.]